jgi:D-alanyl-D-alanine carboxypeptidase
LNQETSAAPEVITGQVLGASESAPEPSAELKKISLNVLPDNLNTAPKPKKTGTEEFILSADSGFALDNKSGEILYAFSSDKKQPIASITKLMTALVFLEFKISWDDIYEIKPGDIVKGGKANLLPGEKVKIKDLFFLSLVGSDNSATMSLVNSTGIDEKEFINLMNKKAAELNLSNTSFTEPTGLSIYNVSTASEIAILAQKAFSDKNINEATLTRKYEFKTLTNRSVSIKNTDYLLGVFPQNGVRILGGKTGFIQAAGYCFAGKFTDDNGREIVSVVLGSENINSRFEETKKLVHWIFNNYKWDE